MGSPLVSTVGFLAVLAAAANGFSNFQLEIPNGEIVPHPCKPNNLWRGVGHENHLGGGARNPFGLDFFANGRRWSEDFCRLDSDGDGKTNGEELGDPNCTWTQGNQPYTSLGLSHPGVCDPFDSPRCNGRPEFVDCEKLQFKCDAIENEGAFNFTVRMPEIPVPVEVTTYMCMTIEFPTGTEEGYHSIATTPVIDNEDIMHHIVVFGCEGDVSGMELNQPRRCEMSGNTQCLDIIGGWTVGQAGQCYNPAAGYLVGGARGYKYAIIQYHWNNPARRDDYTDSSGMTFYLTSRLRPYNAGTLIAGQIVLNIAPGRSSHTEYGRCSSSCTSRDLTGNITVTQVGNHMHYIGISQYTQVRRPDGNRTDLAMDQSFAYDSPVRHIHPEGVTISPGDEISTMCVYKSTSRTTTTFQGEGTHEEMCFSFINYYPKENVRNKLCVSAKSIDQCDILAGDVNGCNFTALLDPINYRYGIVASGLVVSVLFLFMGHRPVKHIPALHRVTSLFGYLGNITRQGDHPQTVYPLDYTPEQTALQQPACTDERTLASTKHSVVCIKGHHVSSYYLGDQITVSFQLNNDYGKPQSHGGANVIARMTNSEASAATNAQVIDHGSGQYSATFDAVFAGKSTIQVILAYGADAIRGMYDLRRKVSGIWETYGVFSNDAATEILKCHPFKEHLGVSYSSQICDLTMENSGMPWFCVKPTNNRLYCEDWVGSRREDIKTFPITSCELTALDRAMQFLEAEVRVTILPDRVSGSLRVAPVPLPCSKFDTTALWTLRRPTGYLFNGTWHLRHCTGNNNTHLPTCLRNRRFLLLGDSTVRQWYINIVNRLDCQHKTEPINLNRIKTEHMKIQPWHKRTLCVNAELNFTAQWLPHSQPFFSVSENNRYTRRSMSRNLDETGSDVNVVALIHLHAHVLSFHHDVFRTKIRKVRTSVDNLLKRNKYARVFIKGGHYFTGHWRIFTDYYTFVYRHIMFEEFRGLHDKVIFLDNKDISECVTNELHPPEYVVTAMVDQMLNYLC